MTDRRPYMPLSVKLEAALIALGLDPATVEWHHDPPLGVRPFKVVNGKHIYSPDANDPRHITPLGTAAHKERYSHDRYEIDKTRRAEEGEREFIGRLLAKSAGAVRRESTRPRKRKIPSRPFPKKQRKRS